VRRDLTVFLVEGLDTGFDLPKQNVIVRHVLLWRIGKIGEQGKVQVRVRVAQEVEFQLLQQATDLAGVSQKRGDDHHRAALGWDAFLKVQPGQNPGRHGVGDEPVDQVDSDGRCR
jgi:hypothetical protein